MKQFVILLEKQLSTITGCTKHLKIFQKLYKAKCFCKLAPCKKHLELTFKKTVDRRWFTRTEKSELKLNAR